MKIPEFGSLQMTRTSESHYGHQKLFSTAEAGSILNGESAAETGQAEKRVSFEEYLITAVKSMNEQQLDVNRLQQQLITDPDSVDIHDVTIAMSKARMSLNLAQTVIDRLVQGWNEITTTR